jgi:hypothetical protein
MPVAGGDNRQAAGMEFGNIAVENRNHLATVRHRKTAAGQKIVLHVDHYQGIAVTQFEHRKMIRRISADPNCRASIEW